MKAKSKHITVCYKVKDLNKLCKNLKEGTRKYKLVLTYNDTNS